MLAAVMAGGLLVGGGLYIWQSGQTPSRAVRQSAPQVAVYTLDRQDMFRRISLYGEIVSDASIDIAPKYIGRITDVPVELGDKVEAGDVLIVHDTLDLELEIAQAAAAARQAAAEVTETDAAYWAELRKVESDYNRKKVNYDRYVSLYEQGAVSKESLDSIYQEMIDSKAAFDKLNDQTSAAGNPANIEIKRAAWEKAQSLVDALVKQRNDMILKAPRAGVIAYRAAEAGQLVLVGQKLLTLVDNSRLYIDCDVSEQDIAAVTTGLPVRVTIDSLGRDYSGVITFVSPAMTSGTRSFQLRIELTDGDDAVKAGMFARSLIEIKQRDATLFVPKEAVLEKNGKMSLFVVDAERKISRREVTGGLVNEAEVEILSGLNEGETVAVSNLSRLSDNVQVEVQSAGEIK